MNDAGALTLKAVAQAIVLWAGFSWFGHFTWGSLITLFVALFLISYVLGDAYILPAFGNWMAVVSDFILAFIVVWLVPYFFAGMTISWFGILAIAVVIAVAEYFVHQLFQQNRQQT